MVFHHGPLANFLKVHAGIYDLQGSKHMQLLFANLKGLRKDGPNFECQCHPLRYTLSPKGSICCERQGVTNSWSIISLPRTALFGPRCLRVRLYREFFRLYPNQLCILLTSVGCFDDEDKIRKDCTVQFRTQSIKHLCNKSHRLVEGWLSSHRHSSGDIVFILGIRADCVVGKRDKCSDVDYTDSLATLISTFPLSVRRTRIFLCSFFQVDLILFNTNYSARGTVGRPVSQYFPIQEFVVLIMIAGKAKGGEVDFWEALWNNISKYIHIPFLKLIPQLDLTVIVVL